MQKRGLLCILTFLFILVLSLSVSAKLYITSYCDASLESCRAQDQALVLLEQKYPYDIEIDYLYYFDTTNAKSSMVQIALECANKQGMKKIYKSTIQEHLEDLSRSALKAYANSVGLVAANFTFCLDTQATAWDVLDEVLTADDDGVTSSPSVRFNMDVYSGSQTYTSLDGLIQLYLGISPEESKEETSQQTPEEYVSEQESKQEQEIVETPSPNTQEIKSSSPEEEKQTVEEPLFFRVTAQFRKWLSEIFS